MKKKVGVEKGFLVDWGCVVFFSETRIFAP